MGQANNRRQHDPLFGKVRQSAQSRGIILSSPMTIYKDSVKVESTSIDPQELRFSMLFWDELVWPSNNLIFIAGNSDEEFLVKEGILTRPKALILQATDVGQSLYAAHRGIFQDLDSREPGKWSISEGERSLKWGEDLINGAVTSDAILELLKAIPIPGHDVPLAEILEFKRRRRTELLMLRAHLESLAKEISSSVDSVDQLAKKIKEVDQACSDLINVAKEWQFPIYLSSLKASISIEPSKSVGYGAAAWTTAQVLGLPMAALATGVAAVGSMINIKSDIGFQSIRRPKNPYRYAYHIEQELRY